VSFLDLPFPVPQCVTLVVRISGGNVTDRTFRLVYKLQERSERAANRVLATLKQVKA
jgi:hypothetical protein